MVARARGWGEGGVVVFAFVEVSEDASGLGFCGESALCSGGVFVSRGAASSAAATRRWENFMERELRKVKRGKGPQGLHFVGVLIVPGLESSDFLLLLGDHLLRHFLQLGVLAVG